MYTPPILDYNCRLLDNITLDKVENRPGLLTSPAEGLLSLEEMIQKGKEQLNIEIKGDVEIQNIGVQDEQSDLVKFCVSKDVLVIVLEYRQNYVSKQLLPVGLNPTNRKWSDENIKLGKNPILCVNPKHYKLFVF